MNSNSQSILLYIFFKTLPSPDHWRKICLIWRGRLWACLSTVLWESPLVSYHIFTRVYWIWLTYLLIDLNITSLLDSAWIDPATDLSTFEDVSLIPVLPHYYFTYSLLCSKVLNLLLHFKTTFLEPLRGKRGSRITPKGRGSVKKPLLSQLTQWTIEMVLYSDKVISTVATC